MGDEVQAIKAGLLEVADLVVVNKGDKPGAQRTAAQLRAMLVASGGPAAGRCAATAADRARSDPRSWSRPRRPAPASRSSSPPSIGTARPATAGADRRRAPRPGRRAGLGDRRRAAARAAPSDRELATRDAARRCARSRPIGSDPYAAADELLGRLAEPSTLGAGRGGRRLAR